MARSRRDDDNDDDRPRRAKPSSRGREDEEDEERPRRRPPELEEDDEEEAPRPKKKPQRLMAVDDDDEDDSEERASKKKKKKKSKKELPGDKLITYGIWGSGAIGALVVLYLLWWILGAAFQKPDGNFEGIDWYKGQNTMKRFDLYFPGGRPTHDLITLRNPNTDVRVRAELWQRKYKGRMYEACYISGDNVSAANVAQAAQNMVNSPPPPDRGAKDWKSKIVLQDSARTIVMRVYGPEQVDENDPLVQAFFKNFQVY
jgi:hypothetical protein